MAREVDPRDRGCPILASERELDRRQRARVSNALAGEHRVWAMSFNGSVGNRSTRRSIDAEPMSAEAPDADFVVRELEHRVADLADAQHAEQSAEPT